MFGPMHEKKYTIFEDKGNPRVTGDIPLNFEG
jgi:hypothetical protein